VPARLCDLSRPSPVSTTLVPLLLLLPHCLSICNGSYYAYITLSRLVHAKLPLLDAQFGSSTSSSCLRSSRYSVLFPAIKFCDAYLPPWESASQTAGTLAPSQARCYNHSLTLFHCVFSILAKARLNTIRSSNSLAILVTCRFTSIPSLSLRGKPQRLHSWPGCSLSVFDNLHPQTLLSQLSPISSSSR